MQQIEMLKSKIHRVRVTDANLDYVGSITIDEDLMDAANVIENEKVQVVNVHSEHITHENVGEKLSGLDGLLVAPGFGHRGIEGKIIAVQFAREKGLPFFGICLGMQMAVIEYARNVLGLSNAHSTEMEAGTSDPVINMMEEQKKIKMMGGTMRLGAYPCDIKEGSLAHKIYGELHISERHRHRYEFNSDYEKIIEKFNNKKLILQKNQKRQKSGRVSCYR